jgi:hypothetical protein
MLRIMVCGAIIVIFASRGIAQTAEESLIAKTQPEIQEQIKKIYSLSLNDDLKNKCKTLEELQKLKDVTKDKGEIVEQLAIFIATTVSEEDLHLMIAGGILEHLDLPPSIPIRVLAPYLDTENEKLRSFAYGWFHNHDTLGRPPLGSVNYYDYMTYVRNRLARNEDVAAGFVNYIYGRHPGKALLVFTYGSQGDEAVPQLKAIHETLEANRQGKKRTPDEISYQRENKRQYDINRQRVKELRSNMLLSEHIISNAIWLKENGFADRFQAALPEANRTLTTLAKHKEWWARLYVAKIMQRNPELRDTAVMERLSGDSNVLVSNATRPTED